MRDVGDAPVGAADPVDQLLDAAGARWRSGQPEPRAVDTSTFFAIRPGSRFDLGAIGRGWSFVAGAAAATAVLLAVALAAPSLVPRLGSGPPVAPAETGNAYIAAGLANCPLTKPNPPFTPPPAPGADYDLSEGMGWYGTARLWTWLKTDGEVWRWLPETAAGRSQKTFWWREGYDVRREPTPEISVTGRRLDGPGRFGFGPPGTNAFWGLGSAMLVGIEIPEAGCWEVTAHYGAEDLTVVVYVEDAS